MASNLQIVITLFLLLSVVFVFGWQARDMFGEVQKIASVRTKSGDQ